MVTRAQRGLLLGTATILGFTLGLLVLGLFPPVWGPVVVVGLFLLLWRVGVHLDARRRGPPLRD